MQSALVVHAPAQVWKPVLHATPQRPSVQVAAALDAPGHGAQLAPQVSGAAFDAQRVPQRWVPVPQAQVRVLKSQRSVAGQCESSAQPGRHIPVPRSQYVIAGHPPIRQSAGGALHVPRSQACPAGHARSQAPQWAASLRRSTQAPPQLTWGETQADVTQAPARHVWPDMHGRPQAPQ